MKKNATMIIVLACFAGATYMGWISKQEFSLIFICAMFLEYLGNMENRIVRRLQKPSEE